MTKLAKRFWECFLCGRKMYDENGGRCDRCNQITGRQPMIKYEFDKFEKATFDARSRRLDFYLDAN